MAMRAKCASDLHKKLQFKYLQSVAQFPFFRYNYSRNSRTENVGLCHIFWIIKSDWCVVIYLTMIELGDLFLTQWAAVTTHWLGLPTATKEPPQ